VRVRKKVNNSRVKLELIPPENFRISRDAITIDDAAFVGIQTDMTRSEIRKYWPEMASEKLLLGMSLMKMQAGWEL
jgi:hypothetical protein